MCFARSEHSSDFLPFHFGKFQSIAKFVMQTIEMSACHRETGLTIELNGTTKIGKLLSAMIVPGCRLQYLVSESENPRQSVSIIRHVYIECYRHSIGLRSLLIERQLC